MASAVPFLSEQFSRLLLSGAFVSFFVGLAVAYAFASKPAVRKTFLYGFLCVVLLVNLTGVTALPVDHLHKFTNTNEATETYYTLHVVDESATEVRVDNRALRPMLRATSRRLAADLATEYDDERARAASCFVLDRASRYRDEVLAGPSAVDYLDFPPHDFQRHWSRERAASLGELTTVRVYRETVTSSASGDRVLNRTSTLAYSFADPEGDRCDR